MEELRLSVIFTSDGTPMVLVFEEGKCHHPIGMIRPNLVGVVADELKNISEIGTVAFLEKFKSADRA